MAEQIDNQPHFLPLADAAARLGISRLKLREAIAKGIVPARRDNEGRLRVDLAAVPDGLAGILAAATVAPEALVEALFDEIEDLSCELDGASNGLAQLARLTEAQAHALDRAMAAADRAADERDRFAGLAARAIDAAEAADRRASVMQSVADRALGLLDRTATEVETARADMSGLREALAERESQIEGQAKQIDRLFSLSEKALQSATEARRAPGLVARVVGLVRGTS